MPFSSGDKALIRNLYWFKKYSLRRILAECLKINCNVERLGMLLAEIWETCSTNQRHETSRLKRTRTEENMITVDEMLCLLNHKDQKQTCCSTCQIFKEMDLTKCSIVQIVQLSCGRIFNNHFIANCLQNASVKKL